MTDLYPKAGTPSTAETDLYSVVGHVTVNWALIDLILDFLVAVAWRHFGGSAIEPEVPIMLKRKLGFLRKAFRELPELAPFQSDFLAMADGISNLSQKRHDCVHGIVSTYGDPFKLLRVKVVDNWHTSHYKEITLKEVNDVGQEIVALGIKLAEFSNDLVTKAVLPVHGGEL